jgi:tRNA(fMet)-specific endonuclease VapC
MIAFILDTDTLSLWQHGHAVIGQHIAAHSSDELAVTIITVQEQLDGWHARLSRAKDKKQLADLYQRLADTVKFLSQVKIYSFSEAAIDRYEDLRKQKLNIGKMDLRIAAIVLEASATLVTRNTSDFSRVPGLPLENWAS